MNHIIKVIIAIAAFFAIATIITNVIPTTLTTDINSAIMFFLNMGVASLANIVHVSVVLTCVKLIFLMTFGFAIVYMVFVLVHMIK